MTTILPALRRAADDLDVQAWLVGGYVRDHLLGRESHDIDVATEGDALGLATRFAELAGAPPPVLFPRFGTAHVRWGAEEIEFATARSESYPDDSRKPEVRPATIREDVMRRDFTVSALLMDLDGNVVDLVRGRRDLEAGTLRTPLDPIQTFSDDPLRMFRAARFAAQLGFGLDSHIPPAMRAMAERARPPKVSVERIADELRKLLAGPWPSAGLEVLHDGGLLAVVLPELEACVGVEQNQHHLWDVWEHTLRVVEGTEGDPIQRLAALFHDVGKPATADGEGHFYDHQVIGAEMTRAAMERMRFSNDEIAAVVKLVRLHMAPMRYTSEWGSGAVRRLARDAGDLLPRLMKLARADAAASAHPEREAHDELERRLAEVRTEQPSRLTLPVTGDDIMAVRGLQPGPEVGRILRALGERVIDGELLPERETLLAAAGRV